MKEARQRRYTTDTLLAVSVEAFIERGYDGTSMEDIARAAGISKSSIYHHVRGKEELLRRAVARALDGLFGVLDRAEEEAVGPDGGPVRAVHRLELVLRGMTGVLLDELPYVTLLLRVRGNTETERWALHRRREFDRRVAALVEAAVAEGDLSDAVRPRLATRLICGMVNSVVEWYHPGHPDPEEIANAVVRLSFAGLCG